MHKKLQQIKCFSPLMIWCIIGAQFTLCFYLLMALQMPVPVQRTEILQNIAHLRKSTGLCFKNHENINEHLLLGQILVKFQKFICRGDHFQRVFLVVIKLTVTIEIFSRSKNC